MKKTTVKEYDIEGRLIKETVIEEDEAPTITYPAPVYPVYPTIQPWVAPWYDGIITITCDSSQKGEQPCQVKP